MNNQNISYLLILLIMTISCAESKKPSLVFKKVMEGDYYFVKKYLEEGNSPNLNREIDNNCVFERQKCVGDTLLNTSLLANKIEISTMLIDYGANFRSQSSSLISPLEIAVELDIDEFIDYLIKSKKINCSEKINGYTMIEIASSNNSLETLELLSFCEVTVSENKRVKRKKQ